jgi:uncharacterized membrane protein YfcA
MKERWSVAVSDIIVRVEAPGGDASSASLSERSLCRGFVVGLLVGLLGGLIGLGGAEFRLPVLITVFGFAALEAVILNKVMTLAVVAAALPARLAVVPLPDLLAYWPVVVNLLAGSLVGAWLGASWATRMRSARLYRVLAVLLVLMAAALLGGHIVEPSALRFSPSGRVLVALIAGVAIGGVTALMGVAGGELLIPAIMLLYGVDIKVAGSLSLLVSLPTMLVAFARYRQDRAFRVVREAGRFTVVMVLGSLTGSVAGGLLLGIVPNAVLVPALALLLIASAVKVWREAQAR